MVFCFCDFNQVAINCKRRVIFQKKKFMLFPVLSFLFVLLLFLNAFKIEFAHDLLDKMIFHPTNIFTALILAIALLSTLIQFLARKDKRLE